jgi:imidazolonepropionase-like amidohydrolase
MSKHIIPSLLFCLGLVLGNSLVAQSFLTPAPPQTEAVLITGGTAHLGTGEVVENAVITFENGKITQVGEADLLGRIDESRYRVINAVGKHIYPGFIAANNQLGLKEIGAVRATLDEREIGSINPSARALIAYNTDSRVIPTIRSNGILLTQSTPVGGRVSGQSSIMQLDAWNWEDAAYRADDGIHLNWPSIYSYRGWWTGNPGIERNKDYGEQKRQIEMFVREAYAYSQKTEEEVETTNLLFESMRGLYDQSKNLYIHVNDVKGITEAVRFGQAFAIRTVIVGGRDAWMITDFLAENEVPILLRQTHSLPSRAHEDVDQPFKTPVQLAEAGVLFGLYMDGFWEIRNLPFQAGQSVGYGLDYEQAVASISLNVARVLGIDDRCGSIEKGKDANLFISEGDALDMRSCKVLHAFIEGREIDLNNKQKMLYQKYKAKYENR